MPTLPAAFWSSPSSWSAAALQAAGAPNVASFTGYAGSSDYLRLTAYSMVELVACPGSTLASCVAINTTNTAFSLTSEHGTNTNAAYLPPTINYGMAGGCTGNFAVPGYASVNISSTPFTLSETLRIAGWYTDYALAGDATTSGGPVIGVSTYALPAAGATLAITAMGFCGEVSFTGFVDGPVGGFARLGQSLLPDSALSPSPSPSPSPSVSVSASATASA